MAQQSTPSFILRRLTSAAFFIAVGLSYPSAAADNDSPYSGLNGREILEAIRSSGRPETIVSSPETVREVILSYAGSSRSIRDYFSETPLSAYESSSLTSIVPTTWFGENSADYSSVIADLHNIVPTNGEVAANRRDYPPGKVTQAVYDNGFWLAGIGTIAGLETNFYEPSDDLKGDFARIYLYMAAVYPQPLWNSRGAMLYIDGYYPLLTPYGREILLDWHRADPVDDAERKRDAAIAAAQGNSNPFVAEPTLAEYIWGRNADEIYNPGSTPENPEPESPDQPDKPVTEPIMLKAVYSVAADKRIDFRSPYVAAGSTWALDGLTVESESIDLSDIGLGRHEISYSNDRSRGKIIITVEP